MTVLPFNLSEFPSINGYMTSGFIELPFKVKAKQGESWRTVKEGERGERGYGALVMRLFLWPKTVMGGEFMVTCLPVSLDEMGTLGGQVKSRPAPGPTPASRSTRASSSSAVRSCLDRGSAWATSPS